MNQPALSIIIPHHDTPTLLSRLLESLPWCLDPEVIVVDDASGEVALEQVHALAEKWPLALYTICRHTAGAARNEGLRHATGRWLLFADADDYYVPEAAALIEKHLEDEADVVYFGVRSAYSDSGLPAYRDAQIRRLIARCQKEDRLNALRCLHTNPWGKMIRRELVATKDIRFEEIQAANDAMFSVRVGVEAARVDLDEEALYCITVGDESLTSRMSREAFECHGEARLRVNAYLREKGWGQYQLSVLSYWMPAWRYGLRYGWSVTRSCCKGGNRLWVGLSRILNPMNIIHSLKSRPRK